MQTDLKDASMNAAVHDLLSTAARVHGDRPWLTVIDQPDGPLPTNWTFAAYLHATLQAADVWRSLGVEAGDRVVIALENRLEFLLAWHGLVGIDAVLVPLNPAFRSREARHIISDSQPSLILADPAHHRDVLVDALADLPIDPQVLHVDAFADAVAGTEDVTTTSPQGQDVDPDRAAAILYTSGTTGAPKGCITTHGHFAGRGQLLASELRMRAADAKLVMLPLFHMNAQNSTMATLAAGSRMILRNGFSASSFWSEIRRHGVTHTHYLGSVLPILDQRRDPLERDNPLEVFWGAGCSGDALPRLEQRWRVRIIEVFGMTETGMDLCNDYDRRQPGSCGRPVAGKEIRLVDADDNEVGPDTAGEITIRRTPDLTPGYYNDDVATDRLFKDGWLRTGDLAQRDRDGFYYFIDRAKDVIRRAGENISSAEVEGVLREHPDVVDAACVPMPDPLRDEEVHAVVVLSTESTVTPQDLAGWCRDRLVSFKVPRYIEFRDDLPRTPTGKIRKKDLRDGVGAAVVMDGTADWAPREAISR